MRMTHKIDVFKLRVLNSLLEAIPLEMGEVLKRTSYHPIFNEVLDFSTALLDSKGQMVASATGIAVHLGALELSSNAVIKSFGIENIKKGDVLIHNNPFPGGTHLPDVDIIMPVFRKGVVIGFAVARGHHGDIGGANPGSFAGNSTSIFQEGIRIPPLKLFEAGIVNEGLKKLLLANVRVPNFTWGDLQAQVAACRLGVARLVEMFDKYGSKEMEETMSWTMDYSEKLMRAAIEKIPDGAYTFYDFLDDDGVDKGKEIKIHVKVTVEGSNITMDYSGSDAQVKGPANCVLGVVYSASYGALFNLTDPSIPKNHGCYRPVTIIAPEGRVVNAKFPSPVVSGNTETAIRMIECVLGALARALPDRVIGGTSGTATAHIAGGVDPRTNELYAWYLGSDPTAWGARATKDGFGCAGGGLIGGSVSQVPMEVFETRYPFIVEEYAYVPDSGGPGKFRGGVSGITVIRPVGQECVMGGVNDRYAIPPYGIFGGMPGLHGDNGVIHADGSTTDLNRAGGVVVKPGETVYFRAPGGGGFGDPLDRHLNYLQHDIDNGYVSIESARRDYGAVIDEATLQIDKQGSEKNRELLKEQARRDQIFIDQYSQPFAKRQMRVVRMGEQVE